MPIIRRSQKRKNPVSLDWFREQGYLKEAILNFLALMGWSPPDEEEVFDLDRFQQEFNIEKISTGAPVFDLVKLDWINGMHIRRMEPQVLLQRLADEGFLPPSVSPEDAATILPLVTERMVRLAEFRDRTDWYFARPHRSDLRTTDPQEGHPGDFSLRPRGCKRVVWRDFSIRTRRHRGGSRTTPRPALVEEAPVVHASTLGFDLSGRIHPVSSR